MYKNVPGSYIPNSPKLGITQIYINSGVDKNTEYAYNEILYRNGKDELVIYTV